jgi:Dolichyl-phosphate-mannose-protein mannosyltransferase
MTTSQHTISLAIAIFLLGLLAVLAGSAAHRESVTIDEVAHTAAGVSYWQKLDMRMNEEHPPLAKLIAALPLVLRRAHADYSHMSWTWSEPTFHQYLGEWVFGHWFLMNWNDPSSTLFWARLPMLMITVLLGWVIYVCATGLGGDWSGLLCLTAYVTMPAFLAFGPLVITDIVVTLFWVLTVWQLPTMWLSPTRAQVLKFGLAFAGTLLSKFSSGLLLFVFPAFALSMRLWPLPQQPVGKLEPRTWRRHGWRNVLKGTLWATLFVYLVYLIFTWNQPTDAFNLIPHFSKSPFLRRLLMPLLVYLRGLIGFAMSAGSRPTYILGHSYPHGVWFYFPVLFFLKSQLAFLLLLTLTLVIAVIVRRRQSVSIIPVGRELHWRSVWVSLVIYTAACLLSRLDISIRHFTIPLALTILLLAPLPGMLESLRSHRPRLSKIGAWSTVALASIALITAVRTYPFYMAFFNSLTMGRPGYALVNDSNLDWNQSLPEAENFLQHHAVKKVLLDEYGFSDPKAYMPNAQWWDCQTPSAADAGQWAVLSANMVADGHNCLWLMRYPHHVLAGGSLYAVQLPVNIPAAGLRAGPPLPKDYHYFGGFQLFGEDPRTIFWNCIHDPQQLQVTWDHFSAVMQSYAQKNKKP